MNESIRQYRQLFIQKIQMAISDVDECILQYLSFGTGKRQESVEKARTSVQQVCDMIVESDRPPWLTALLSALEYAAGHKNEKEGAKYVSRIATELFPSMKAHDWQGFYEHSNAEVGIEIDSIYDACRRQHKVHEHFEKIIEYLKEIAESGEIDSIKLKTELLRIIATLERSKDGSYFATHCCYDFLKRWMERAAWGNLAKLPIIGPTLKALEETLKETGLTLQEVEAQFYSELQQKFTTNYPGLGYQLKSLPPVETDK